MDETPIFLWLGPTLAAMFAWGIAQGLVKKYVGEVPPARFCLYYALANATVNTLFFYVSRDANTPDIFAAENRMFLVYGLGAYLLDGLAWIFYYQSIVYGPISIVGTLSAAYPAITIVLARFVLAEKLAPLQYVGVFAVLAGCLALAYSPKDESGEAKQTQKRWMGFAGAALAIWGVNGVLIKLAYAQPGSSEVNLVLFIAVGGMATLGVYGFLKGRAGALAGGAFARSFLPMAMMALGGLFAALAYKKGPASIVTPLSGAYPVITLTFAMFLLKERPTKIHWGGIVSILFGGVLTALAPAAEQAPADPTTTASADGGTAVAPAGDAGTAAPTEAPPSGNPGEPPPAPPAPVHSPAPVAPPAP